jgi:hypothetical protein
VAATAVPFLFHAGCLSYTSWTNKVPRGECGTFGGARPAQRLSLHSDFSYDAAQYTGR